MLSNVLVVEKSKGTENDVTARKDAKNRAGHSGAIWGRIYKSIIDDNKRWCASRTADAPARRYETLRKRYGELVNGCAD